MKLREYEFTERQIYEKLGFIIKHYRNFITCYNNQKKLDAGITIHKKGRSCKDCVATE